MNEELQDFVEAKAMAEKRISAEIDKLIKAYPQIKGFKLKGRPLTFDGSNSSIKSYKVQLDVKF